MNKIHEILEHSDKNGTVPTLNFLESEVEELQGLIHLIKVIDFCDIIKILLEYGICESYSLKLKINFIIKNDKYVYIKYEMYNSHNELLNRKNLNYKRNQPLKKIAYGIESMLDKFQNTSVKFLNEAVIKEPKEIILNHHNIEVLRNFLLNKELFSSYQSFYLQKTLKGQREEHNLKKI